jgi:prepilin-type N-terminal cleavage/methylation domain-containing protein
MRANRRAFSLLEVMIALAILVTALTLLAEIQSTAILMTKEGERLVTASNLAQEKMAEITLRLESEGFTDIDVCESGDFKEFGDEVIEAEFGDRLDDYHFEWCVSTVDVALAGDIAGMAGGLAGGGYFPGDSAGQAGASLDAASALGGAPDLSSMGLGPEQISEMLGKYVREVRVRVWWGQESKQAEKEGDEVVVITHAINPTGAITATQQGATQ